MVTVASDFLIMENKMAAEITISRHLYCQNRFTKSNRKIVERGKDLKQILYIWKELMLCFKCAWKKFLVTAAILDGEWSCYINIWIFYMVVLTRFGLIWLYGFRKTFSNDFLVKSNLICILKYFFDQKSKKEKCLLR
jgi:hypothetical protein